ncbi:MAG TPA: hypothetical protein VF573_19380 [Paraburkholderia sp.]|uniref:hypothetical protein n=1 Tax=Paraburkholderia sp. TaxID=1926495 RepID=UPI002ED479F0
MPKGKSSGSALASARFEYSLELARGSSYIGSTLTPETEERAIAETIKQFCVLYGEAQVTLFQKILAEELQHRGNQHAALAVAQFKFNCTCGAR